MFLVTKENQNSTPAPLGCIVRWQEWKKYYSAEACEDRFLYTIRRTDPLSEEDQKSIAGLQLVESDTFQMLSVIDSPETAKEDQAKVYPFHTYYVDCPASMLIG